MNKKDYNLLNEAYNQLADFVEGQQLADEENALNALEHIADFLRKYYPKNERTNKYGRKGKVFGSTRF